MIRLERLTLRRGTRVLLEEASLSVSPRHKIGLVGANGCGKSSLFAALRGELLPDAGEIALPPSWVIASVAQETPPTDTSALDYVLDGDRHLRQLQARLAAAEADPAHAGEALAELHHELELAGAYSAPARAQALLAGLGFAMETHARSVASFSGGWRMRLNLAQALMCPSDLLLLDEPTNHLDLEAVMWLEEWLGNYPGTLILISHDRDFLDATVDTIVHVEERKLASYPGNFETFERMRAERLALQQSLYARQQREIAHLTAFVDRFRAKATKARQAQSRLRTLERMERIAAAHVDSPFNFAFAAPAQSPRQLLSFEDVSLGYADTEILSAVNWSLLAGERVGLLGPNGAGKSTLLKAIAGVLAPRSGTRHTGQGLAIGYFAQHQVEALRLEHSALWHLQRLSPEVREQDLRNFLGGFDFQGDRVLAPVNEFSGGEKARLTLALLVWQRPNLLLLDEPTNHLDLEMRQALTTALQDYEGGLVVVAHDRHLLRATTDQFWLVAEGRLAPFDGDLDDYRAWVATRRAESLQKSAADKRDGGDRRSQRRAEAQARERLAARTRPLRERIDAIESELAAQQRECAELERWLASEEAYGEAHKLRLTAAVKRLGEVRSRIELLEEDWLETQSALEEAAIAAD